MRISLGESRRRSLALLLALMLAVPSAVYAKARSASPDERNTDVVAHLMLTGNDVTGMLERETQGRRYLFIERSSLKAITLVDITNPKKPVLKGEVAYPEDVSGGNSQLVGSNLLLVKNNTADRKTDAPPSSVIVLGRPNEPTAKRQFTGLTSFLADNAHGLVYLTNSEGLWILRIKDSQYDDDLRKFDAMLGSR